jgi:protein-S-isoprenylcysteine O-methyltransferase Ste14
VKKVYQQKYGELAYRNAFVRFVLPGLATIFADIAHAGYMDGPLIPRGGWVSVFYGLGWLMLAVGAALWMRAVFTFGADNLALLYVYYPQEGRIVNSSIYKILRHPVYAGVLRVGIGLALLNGNAFSITFALLMPLGLTGWIRLVEERELIERFGQGYLDYRKSTPAFWPKARDLGRFFIYIFKGD